MQYSAAFEQVMPTYARADALSDGTLVDVTVMAAEAGIHYPVAVTRGVWDRYVIPDEQSGALGHTWEGRLWAIFTVFRWETRSGQPKPREWEDIPLELCLVMEGNRWERVTLRAVLAPEDDTGPVITIMAPDEV